MPTDSINKIRHSAWFRQFRVLKIDLYLLTEVIGPLLGGIFFFSFVFLMFQALRLAEFFIIHGIPASTLMKMAALMVLSFMPTALPVAFLIAVLMAFGRLSADSELVAMKSCGIGVFRLTLPVLALALVVVLLSLGLNMEWVPWGDRNFKSILIKVSNTKVASSVKAGTFTSGFFDLLIFADKVDNHTGKLQHVFIFDEREAKNPMTIIAESGEIVTVRTESELGAAAVLRLHDGSIHKNDLGQKTYQKLGFGEYRLYLKIDEGSDNSTIKPRMIPYEQLVQQIDHTDQGSEIYRELKAEFWRRYAVALTPFIFVFLGIGYGTIRTRSVRAGATLVAFVVLVVYWALQAWSTVAAQKGQVPPWLAMEIPNLVILLAAIRGFRSAIW